MPAVRLPALHVNLVCALLDLLFGWYLSIGIRHGNLLINPYEIDPYEAFETSLEEFYEANTVDYAPLALSAIQ